MHMLHEICNCQRNSQAEGDTPRGPFLYFLNEGHPGAIIEMAEATATRMRIFDAVRDAAAGVAGPSIRRSAGGLPSPLRAGKKQLIINFLDFYESSP